MRILHVSPYAPAAWAYGGIPRVVGALTRELARRGHQVTLCTTDARDQRTRLPNREGARDHEIDVRVFRNASNRLAYDWQFYVPIGLHRFMASHAAEFDVAHLHAHRNLPATIAAYHLSRAGVPYLLAPNGTAPRIEQWLLAKRAFDALLGDRTLASASRVLAVSAAEERQFAAIGVASSRVRTLPNPVAVEDFDALPPRGMFRRRAGIPFDVPLVVFLGRLSPRKRVDLLIEAFAELNSSAHLAIVGNDMGAGASLRRLVESRGVSSRTRMTGLQTGADRVAALVDADVVVYPSEHEIFGLVALEALLAGTPVIVSDDSGCGEVVGAVARGGGGHVVPTGQVAPLRRAIEHVLAAGEDERAAARAAAARVRTCFSASAVCTGLEGVYQEMVERR